MMTLTLNKISFKSNKAPKNAKGSKTRYGIENSSNSSPYIKSGELSRQNKNKTQSQQRQTYKTLEGVIVNNYIKDDNNSASLNMDDICTSLVIPDTYSKNTHNDEMLSYKNKEEKKTSLLRSIFPLAALSILSAAGILGITALMKKSASSLNNKNVLRQERLPNLGMNMNIKQEHEFGAYMALRNPNKKTILAMIGIFIMSGLTLVGKNLVDGVQEIWVKKKTADADKKLQDELIEIETKAFAGKLDVINEELINKANYFKHVLNSTPESSTQHEADFKSPFLNFFGFKESLNFKGNVNNNLANGTMLKTEETDGKKEKFANSPFALGTIVFATLALGIIMSRKMFKNFVAADSEVRKYVNNETAEIEKRIKIISDKIKTAETKEAAALDLDVLKNLLQIKRADSLETGQVFSQFKFLSDKDVANNTNEVMVGIKSIYGDAPETLGGKVGQIQYYCYLDEARGHIYNWIMNPENPFAGYLFLTLTIVNAAGYSIRKTIEGIKEAAVIKENKNTEKQLQERLVDTEVKNFKSKKQSAIEPLMNEFNARLNSGASKEELKNMADNILLEIKNGPPFVYS